jgi:succinate dehydrogenase hydrophobic anchor subunit
MLGLQVVIEDYVHHGPAKLTLELGMKAVLVFCALASAVSILKLAI